MIARKRSPESRPTISPAANDVSAGRKVRASARDNPSGRGVAAGYTSLVRWLASPEAEFIQGQIIFVNGGANLSG
jgi:hypothetical protein